MKPLKKLVDAVGLILHYPVKPRKRVSVLFDILKQYRNKGVSFREYYSFEFEKQPESFRKSYLGFCEERHYLDILNPIKFYVLSFNKYLTHKVLENTGIRTSTLYCYYQPDGRVSDSDVIATCVTDVCRILKAKNVRECVVKQPEGSHGANVFVVKDIHYTDDDVLLIKYNDQEVKLSEIINKVPLIFESRVHQTAQLASFNASSVNTVRFMTTLYPDGSARVIATWFKVGRDGNCVDNAGSGGNVDSGVDVNTGKLFNVRQFDGWRNSFEIEKHPDSGAQLNGVVIENWDAIKAEVIRYQQAFPYCRAAGWDVAITDDGPVVLEVNDRWDTTGQFFIRHGWREEIRDCYFAWKKENRDDGNNDYRIRKNLSKRHLRRIVSQ